MKVTTDAPAGFSSVTIVIENEGELRRLNRVLANCSYDGAQTNAFRSDLSGKLAAISS